MAPLTIFLSRLIGLFALLTGLAMALRRESIVATALMLVRDPALLFVLGMIALLGGLAMVLSHNIWSGGAAPVIITLLGWIFLIRGLLLLSLPTEEIAGLFTLFRFEELYYAYIGITLALGVFLTYAGFKARTKVSIGPAEKSETRA